MCCWVKKHPSPACVTFLMNFAKPNSANRMSQIAVQTLYGLGKSSSLDFKKMETFAFCFFVDDVIIWVGFCNFGPRLPAPGHQPNKPFFGSSFCWQLGYNLSLWFLDWFCSVSGSKMMAQKSKFWQKYKSYKKGMICLIKAIFCQP